MALQPRPSISQGVQLGAETTEGTSVAANRKLQSIGMMLSPKAEIAGFRPSGNKYRTVHAVGKEYSAVSIEGQPTFDELQYLLCGLLKNVTPTTSDTTARTWTFEPAATTEDTVKTYTIEQGGTVRAHKATGLRINGMTLSFDRNEVKISGDGFARAITDGITMTGAPTLMPLVPLLPADMAVFLDTTSGGLGTTRLEGVLSGEFAVTDRFTQLWTVNDALSSYAAGIEKEPTASLKLVMNADADGMALLSAMRNGSTRFIRIKNTSSVLAGATTVYYTLTIDAAVQIQGEPPFGETDDDFTVTWDFACVTDATWNKTISVALVNKQATL